MKEFYNTHYSTKMCTNRKFSNSKIIKYVLFSIFVFINISHGINCVILPTIDFNLLILLCLIALNDDL